MFAFPDWWITDIGSFTKGGQSQVYLQAISDSVLFRLSKENFDALIENYPSFESSFRYMMQYAYIREQRRSLELIKDSAAVRYNHLLLRHPTIEEHVTQKDISSYLGVTPEFFSTLRRKNSTTPPT